MIRLVERDYKIIEYLREQGWALGSQLAVAFFAERHSCSNRLRQLVDAGILESLGLSEFRKKYWHEQGLLNAICELSGKNRVYRLGPQLRNSIGKRWQRASSDFMVAHQVLLTRVRSRLESEFPSGFVISEATESLRKNSGSSGSTLPDLVIQIGSMRLAVEMERRARRGLGRHNFSYDERFRQLAVDYDAVLYVVESENDFRALARRAQGMRRVGFCSILNLGVVLRCDHEAVTLERFVTEFVALKGAL